ncbi:hypothetical protein [Arthrobacter sp. NPDC056493]|uniref:hypothetical protein n=1 Tax=Arthrobacter sp. NPDC056493 TaxID=3345839 RepID=UPI003671F915
MVAIPWQLSPSDLQWDGVISRIAAPLNEPTPTVATAIRNAYIDVTDFRAADDILIEGTIPVEAGFSLISTARTILRASATTSRGVRSQIGGNYSKPAERIVEQARFGHTKKGSYILPMLVPLDANSIRGKDSDGHQLFSYDHEPEERRATRTMAQALTAVQQLVVDPGKEPSITTLDDLVTAGVSREMVAALHDVVSTEAVSTFSATFQWAAALESNSTLPKSVSIAAGASDLLQLTAKKMRPSPKKQTESFTGPIVQLRDEESLTFGEVKIQTVRKGRSCEIAVFLADDNLRKSHEWFSTKETLVVEGEVTSVPGKGLRITSPARVQPLRETMLFGAT